MVSIVYMVAGLSSRFGGKIKQFARVGPNNETLIELSMSQAISAGFDKIIFVVGEKTEQPFKEIFGNKYKGTPVFYAKQVFDISERDKPWGSADAVVSAKKVIGENFVVCNGDDLYGKKAFKSAFDFLKTNKTDCVAIGYTLGSVIPEKGSTNRGIFSVDKNNYVISLEEILGIEKEKLSEKSLSESDLCSMNLFGLRKEVLELLSKRLDNFKSSHKGDRKLECYLPVELSGLIKEGKVKMKLLPTQEQWFGVTNPEDEETIRVALSKQ